MVVLSLLSYLRTRVHGQPHPPASTLNPKPCAHENKTKQTVQEINLLLSLYENSQALHRWVRRRVRDGKELPRSKSECQVLMMGDPAGISVSSYQYVSGCFGKCGVG